MSACRSDEQGSRAIDAAGIDRHTLVQQRSRQRRIVSVCRILKRRRAIHCRDLRQQQLGRGSVARDNRPHPCWTLCSAARVRVGVGALLDETLDLIEILPPDRSNQRWNGVTCLCGLGCRHPTDGSGEDQGRQAREDQHAPIEAPSVAVRHVRFLVWRHPPFRRMRSIRIRAVGCDDHLRSADESNVRICRFTGRSTAAESLLLRVWLSYTTPVKKGNARSSEVYRIMPPSIIGHRRPRRTPSPGNPCWRTAQKIGFAQMLSVLIFLFRIR